MKTKIQNKTIMKKPIQLRTIFILNLILVIICYIFFGVASSKGSVGGLKPTAILYTTISYSALFIALIAAIKKFNLLAFRTVIALVFLVSIPTTAIIGMVIAIISLVISFHNKIVSYFNQ
jgi:hypothetical protein